MMSGTERKLRVGDRVRMRQNTWSISSNPSLRDAIAKVVYVRPGGGTLGVDFGTSMPNTLHDLGGKLASPSGWFFYPEEVKLVSAVEFNDDEWD